MDSFPIYLGFEAVVQPEDVALARSANAIEQLSITRPLIQKIGSTRSSLAEVSHPAVP